MTDSFIRLENLTKTFQGSTRPAVDNLELHVRQGEIVMLVGPSGCGKTTTLKMINRLIEPTSGRIIIGGQDVTDADPNELRRSIGYVIQQGGLFPHLRVGDNVAAVLKLLRWPASKISSRVDEMLDLVGLDPSQYRHRYPKELSGGQRQRVGVARALAADPLIMLLDEPFGAVDPISRESLQNEFLRLQEHIGKTIVFVTHDLTEAIKMGDRIAVVGEHSIVAQFDTPAQILANPANDFVREFLGENAELRALSLLRVKHKMLTDFPSVTVLPGETEMVRVNAAATVVLEDGRPIGWLMVNDGDRRFLPVDPLQMGDRTTLADAVGQMMRNDAPAAILVGPDGRLAGCLEFAAVTRAVTRASVDQAVGQSQVSEVQTNASHGS
jgi:osmoprotectant transport system ATP-binding protein